MALINLSQTKLTQQSSFLHYKLNGPNKFPIGLIMVFEGILMGRQNYSVCVGIR